MKKIGQQRFIETYCLVRVLVTREKHFDHKKVKQFSKFNDHYVEECKKQLIHEGVIDQDTLKVI